MPKRTLTITELNTYIKGVFEDELILHSITIVGEVEDFKISSGNTYFTLKDSEARLSCIKFGVHEPITAGVKLEAEGSVSFYAKTAKVSFVVRHIKAVGVGDSSIAFLQLKEQLEKEGLFKDKKQPPRYAPRVCLITSDTGAVLQDFTRIFFEAGGFADSISVIAVRVQGDSAQGDIIKAFDLIARHSLCDIAILMRGGGSSGDLSVFNLEGVARALSHCNAFTISAIGHETDNTLCDLVADLRLSTPSAAARKVADINSAAKESVIESASRLTHAVSGLYNSAYARLMLAAVNVERFASAKVELAAVKAKHLIARLAALLDNIVLKHEQRMVEAAIKLDALSPLKTLSKGYARVEKKGKAVTGVKGLKQGESLKLFFADGSVDTIILNKFTN